MLGPRSLTLLALGDVMLGRQPAGLVGGVGDATVYKELHSADLVFGNLEVPLTERGYPADKAVSFRAPPGLANALASMGFDVVSVANNHMLDFGVDGLLQTIDVVRAAGVEIVGGGANLFEALRPVVLERNGLRVSFMGVACTLPPGSRATDVRPGVVPIRVITEFAIDPVSIDEQPGMAPFVRTWAVDSDVEAVQTALHEARDRADVVILGIHWGVTKGWVADFQDILAEYQRPLGHKLIDAGADLIVGHHPHTPFGIERYGSGWIIYSAGNFLSHQLSAGLGLRLSRPYPPYRLNSLTGREVHESVLYRVALGPQGVTKIELLPLLLDELGEPRVLAGEQAQKLLARIDEYSRPLGSKILTVGDQGTVRMLNEDPV